MAFIDDFIFDFREIEIMRNDSILPCHHIIGYLRIMIPIPFFENLEVKGVVDKPQALKKRKLFFRFGKEPDIKVGCTDLHPVCLGRIEGGKCLRDILCLVRILQTSS